MNRTRIEWTQWTWTPASGCLGIGCAVRKVCWARKIVKRLGRFCPKCPGFIPHMHWDRIGEPLELKKPAKIFPVSTGDLFGLNEYQVALILNVMKKAYWHTFQILTKQPQNALKFNPYWSNVWFGVTVNQQSDVWRLDELRKICAKIKFASFEPLYSPIAYDLSFLDWLIIGAQSRPNLQPKTEWVEEIIRQASNAAIFLKDNLEGWPKRQEFPKG